MKTYSQREMQEVIDYMCQELMRARIGAKENDWPHERYFITVRDNLAPLVRSELHASGMRWAVIEEEKETLAATDTDVFSSILIVEKIVNHSNLAIRTVSLGRTDRRAEYEADIASVGHVRIVMYMNKISIFMNDSKIRSEPLSDSDVNIISKMLLDSSTLAEKAQDSVDSDYASRMISLLVK